MHNPLLKKVLESYKGAFFIPENVPSGKNSRICVGHFLKDSKSVKNYKAVTAAIWANEEIKEAFIATLPESKPYFIGFHFIKATRHKFDFINPLQTIQDLMVRYKWIEDDNTDIMFPVPLYLNNQLYTTDKENPGVIIKVVNNKKIHSI